jgi:hypothetical protein
VVPILQEAGWALGPVWVGTENLLQAYSSKNVKLIKERAWGGDGGIECGRGC